ncbi:LCP family protein [Staphylococcus kloosii]|uniref:LCP family protein n=1 Tax=Staphylococcus kloosii TaxID=29384 RepID=UPI001E4A8D3A|nr:LCP family protein [Staphylococcus kloosii]MCD8878834.1 LCP family protein [Staphylococcus kloosii]
MKLTKKGKLFIIAGIILLIILGYAAFKIIHLNASIHDSNDNREETKATKEKVKNNKPLSIAIFGVDSDANRAKENMGQRTDTILIASINTKTKKTKLISVPRDMEVQVPGVNGKQKIAHAYAYGGPQKAIATLNQQLNVPIDGYVTVDMDGFEKMIDIFDGVTLKSNATFSYNGSSFKKGKRVTLKGEKALNYVRSRKQVGAGGDEGRTARQRQVIDALAKSASNSFNIFKLNKVLKVSEKNVKTDLSLSDLKTIYTDYKNSAKSIDKMSINGQNLIESDGIWYFEPDQTDLANKVKAYKDNLK